MGEDLGIYHGSDITPGSLKMRVEINGLLPLLKTYALEFAKGGGEITTTMVYEKLDKHCLHCSKLDHEREGCPELTEQRRNNITPTGGRRDTAPVEQNRYLSSRNNDNVDRRQEHQRREDLTQSYMDRQRSQRDGPYRGNREHYAQPTKSYVSKRRGASDFENSREQSYHKEGSYRSSNRREERWVETGRHLTPNERGAESVEGRSRMLSAQSDKRRGERERNRRSEDAEGNQGSGTNVTTRHEDRVAGQEEEIPRKVLEEAREELREVMIQYTSCADPTESAARRERVRRAEEQGEVEETAENMARRMMNEQRALRDSMEVESPEAVTTRTPAVLRLGDPSLPAKVGENSSKQGRVSAKKRLGRPPLTRKPGTTKVKSVAGTVKPRKVTMMKGSPKRKGGRQTSKEPLSNGIKNIKQTAEPSLRNTKKNWKRQW
ncbi:hypothetical protein F2Q68_00044547 [Brassica cretica]|uniref:Zinc knuckle CX2CX4HX4C domain-containing protein n=1 Tax=Brassica cretica TaxID=69181 RepID=A0A8S9LQ98_BRACR|nr:hypothetical protein F2Q68_00044547 [Brassica cretica]